MRVVIPAFVISELQTAFQMGFLIFLPFLVIDFLVSSILMALGGLISLTDRRYRVAAGASRDARARGAVPAE